ncbi:hypothetical protein [Gilvibacter sp.]|uniref:hypothetical protein n=1 Tax=Gilvibacter sp. TaxID=2729997 RepID=UPI0035BE70BD
MEKGGTVLGLCHGVHKNAAAPLRREAKSRKLRVKRIKKELEPQAGRMSSLEAKFLDDQVDANAYHKMKQNIEAEIAELKAERKEILNMKKDIEEYLKLGISFLHGVDKLYKNSNAEIKRKITGSIFPENLTFLENSYRTAFPDELIAAILSKHSGFQFLEIKNPAISGGKSNMAPPIIQSCSTKDYFETLKLVLSELNKTEST